MAGGEVFSKKVILLLLLFNLLFYSTFSITNRPVVSTDKQTLPTFYDEEDAATLSKKIVEAMNDEELLAQVLMFGFAGDSPNSLLYRWVEEKGLGSIKIFGWNTKDLSKVASVISSLQKSAYARRFKIPLFIATDQEGGWVRHVKGETSVTPGNMAIGATGLPMDAYYSGYYIAKEIKCLGINMNFAPTVDLFTNHNSTIINTRSYGDNPTDVSKLAVAFTKGVEEAGVLPTAKHFPGHGDTDDDSHVSFPVIKIDDKTFMERELVPFKALIQEGVSAIMSGHLSFPNVDKSEVRGGVCPPASLSEYMLTTLLRNSLGFQGLIITDDMMMNGVTQYAPLSMAYKLAIEAGNNIIISSKTAKLTDPLWTSNLSLMKKDSAFRQKVKAAARLVIYTKLNYFRSQNAAPLYPNPATIKDNIPSKEGEAFFLNLACRAITLYKKGNIPFNKKTGGRILLVGGVDEFFTYGKKYYPAAAEFKYNYEIGPIETLWMCDHINETARAFDTIIVCVHNERTARIAATLKVLNKKIYVFSLLNPVDCASLADFSDSIIVGYSYSPYTIRALFAVLNGEFIPKGEFPFKDSKVKRVSKLER